MNWKLFWVVLLPTMALFGAALLFAVAGLKILSIVVIMAAYACICLSGMWAPHVMRWLDWDM